MFETRAIPPDVELVEVACDLCGSSDLEEWDRARANTLTRCTNCGLVFTNPRVKDVKTKETVFYADTYFTRLTRMGEKLEAARRATYAREINDLEKYVPRGQILDVGCGTGIFLAFFGDHWQKFGCDVSGYGLSEAARRGVRTFHGEFEYLSFGDQKFDVIYFRASLHHAYSPARCLEKAWDLLRPGGLVAITMSNNCDGICGRLFRGHVRSYEQAHNYLFSRATLQAYLRKRDFVILGFDYPYFGTGYGSVMDFLVLPWTYFKFLALKTSRRLNQPDTWDFSSPPMYGNYINAYARKV